MAMHTLSYNAVRLILAIRSRNRLSNLFAIIFLGITYSLAFSTPAHSQVIEVLEAEQGILKNAKVSPKGYVELNAGDSKLGTIEWAFNAPRAGDYEIRFRYRVNQKEFSPLMAISTSTYDIAKKRFFQTPGKTWQDEAWLIKADANEQVIVRLGVNKPSLNKNRVERIFVDKLTIDQPSFLTANVKVVPEIHHPEFRKIGYENTYYGKVDPQGQRTTLKKWLRVNGYTKKSNKTKIVRSQYINSFDLGFGRSMSCLDVGHLSCYVDNYINLDKEKPVTINTKLPAFAATVTMEKMNYLDPVTQQSRLITAFYVYDKEGRRINRAPLDNEGAKAVPESCYACHKGNIDSNGNPVGGQFLPWDLHLLDENLRGSPAVAKQHEAIRELNHMVWKDAAVKYDPNDPSKVRKQSLKDLIEGWYGGEPLPGAAFNSKFIPSNWFTDPASANVQCSGVPTTKPCKEKFSYQNVYAVYCRTCHVTHGEGQDVGLELGRSWNKAEEFRADAFIEICTSPNAAKLMPNAELTFHRFSSDIVPGTGRTAKDILCSDVKKNNKPTANPDVGPDTLVNVGSQTSGNVKTGDAQGFGADVLGDGTAAENTATLVSPKISVHGELDLNPNGTYTYTLQNGVANSAVTDGYTYKLTDVDGDSSLSTLTINISGPFQAIPNQRDVISSPLVCTGNVTPNTSCNVMANDSRGDGNVKVAETLPIPTNPLGDLVLNDTGTYTYTVRDVHYFDNDINNSITLTNSCNAEDTHNYTLTSTANNPPTPVSADLIFTIKPNFNGKADDIFSTNCSSCHDGVSQSHISTFPSKKVTVNSRVQSDSMPELQDIGGNPANGQARWFTDQNNNTVLPGAQINYRKAIIDCWSKQ
jgi:cytochrome c5